jgi:SAM-dependent methyltransferase
MIARRYDPAVPEMMDRPGHDPALLRADLDVLETINRFLGGHRIPLRYLPQFNARTVLDLTTGAGDIPRALAGRYEVTGVDKNPDILRIARERSPGIRFEQHDLLDLPYAAGSFDVVLCSLALHHFTEDDAVVILRRRTRRAGETRRPRRLPARSTISIPLPTSMPGD